MLYNRDRLHFSLLGEDLESLCQIAPGESFSATDDDGNAVYHVTVQFVGGMFGSFMQWVAFDFGTRPVLVKKLNVKLGVQIVQEKVKELRQKLTFDRYFYQQSQNFSLHLGLCLKGFENIPG